MTTEERILDMSDLDIFNPIALRIAPAFAPEDLYTIPVGSGTHKVIAFDQAIANTGWVVILHQEGIVSEIIDAGTIKTVTTDNRTSWDDTLYRSQQLLGESLDLLWKHFPDLVLTEMPPIGTGPFVRGSYSSIVAATAIWAAAHQAKLPIALVSAQKAKKFLTGKANAKKPEVRKAVQSMIDSGQLFINPEEPLRLNEHIVDAIGIALTFRNVVQ